MIQTSKEVQNTSKKGRTFTVHYTGLDKKAVYSDLNPSFIGVYLKVENIKNIYNNWH
jgi:hypothetical protein